MVGRSVLFFSLLPPPPPTIGAHTHFLNWSFSSFSPARRSTVVSSVLFCPLQSLNTQSKMCGIFIYIHNIMCICEWFQHIRDHIKEPHRHTSMYAIHTYLYNYIVCITSSCRNFEEIDFLSVNMLEGWDRLWFCWPHTHCMAMDGEKWNTIKIQCVQHTHARTHTPLTGKQANKTFHLLTSPSGICCANYHSTRFVHLMSEIMKNQTKNAIKWIFISYFYGNVKSKKTRNSSS